MIEKLMYLALGFLLGLYTGYPKFRNQINKVFKKLFSSLRKLEFKGNHKPQNQQGNYEDFYNRSYYCILPGCESLTCGFDGYCGDCPMYLNYKKDKNQVNNNPMDFGKDYW